LPHWYELILICDPTIARFIAGFRPEAEEAGHNVPMARTSDRVRVILVAVTAVLQTFAVPLTTWMLGPSSATSTVSEAYRSPVTPAGFSFYIWGLIYLGCLAIAAYQLLPGQHARRVHRRTGWWLAGGFLANAFSVLIFGTRVIWLAQEETPELRHAAEAAAAKLGLPLTVVPTGTSGLERALASLLT